MDAEGGMLSRGSHVGGIAALAEFIAEEREWIDTGVVPIHPREAEGVGSDPVEPDGPEISRKILGPQGGRTVVPFALAPRTGTAGPEVPPGVLRTVTVRPDDGEDPVGDGARLDRRGHALHGGLVLGSRLAA